MHRHFYVTQLSHLYCARLRQKLDPGFLCADPLEHLTVEQVRRAMNIWLDTVDLKPAARRSRFQKELETQHYHQRRNCQSRRSHTKTRLAKLKSLGIDPDRIRSCADAPRE